MKIFYLVMNTKTNYSAYRHESRSSAIEEAKRLARIHVNDEFIVLAAFATVKKVDVVVDEVKIDDNIPF